MIDPIYVYRYPRADIDRLTGTESPSLYASNPDKPLVKRTGQFFSAIVYYTERLPYIRFGAQLGNISPEISGNSAAVGKKRKNDFPG